MKRTGVVGVVAGVASVVPLGRAPQKRRRRGVFQVAQLIEETQIVTTFLRYDHLF